jgi:hypothetical protein
VYALVLSFIVALVLHMRSAYCFIAWFPGIVLVGFLLAEVRPPTVSTTCTLYMLLKLGKGLSSELDLIWYNTSKEC